MFDEKEEKTEEVVKSAKGSKSIKALRDFCFMFENKIYDLKEGEKYDVPACLLANLKTEKVIK